MTLIILIQFEGVKLIFIGAIAFSLTGCIYASKAIRMETDYISAKLGFPGCKVSVSLTLEELVQMGRKLRIYPNPEDSPELGKLISIQEPGDILRQISCQTPNLQTHVLIRNNEIIFKFDVGFLD